MTIRLEEVMRSEVEGGLTGPANPIPSQSIDCGCGQLPCPKLAKFATRGLFVGLMSWVGLIQAAGYAYFYITGPTIARRFQFDPYLMDWVLKVSEITPFFLGLLVAYWGDRIHRAAWIGAWVLLQSASYFLLIIPQLTHRVKVIEETEQTTHMSLYADDSPELCSAGSSRIIIEEDRQCYFTLAIIIVVQIICGIANTVYYALGISYLDDNTKKRHVAAFVGVILAVKIIGLLLGYILAWGCLRIDAETLSLIESYREQIGAWWLGFPILTILLIVPGLLLSWFPRMLPSEVVERAAASLLHNTGRYNRVPRRSNSQKARSPDFWPSIGRLFVNRILFCNVLALVLCATALLNFMYYENMILESRFHVPRPTGMLLGFGDPMSSRLISNTLKPILVGLIVIISGLVIAKGRPSARNITLYAIAIVLLIGGIIFSLSFVSCNKSSVVGTEGTGSLVLLKYCNRKCGCSNDAEFRPVCDMNGKFIFYSPCHAGCTSSVTKDGVTTYDGCSCVEEKTGKGNTQAKDGPCNTNSCQISWLLFEFGTMLAYALAASMLVGDLLIILRSVKAQDKAISIGFFMMWIAIIVNVAGRILYEVIANITCRYWGSQKLWCHLYDSPRLGDYLCYLTISILALCLLFKILVWFFCKNLKLYLQPEDNPQMRTEMQELIPEPTTTSGQQTESSNVKNNANKASDEVETTVHAEPVPSTSTTKEDTQKQEETLQTRDSPLKYGPLGPGDRRTDSKNSTDQRSRLRKSKIRSLDSEDELCTSSDEETKRNSSPNVAYRPLDLDSDVESDLSSIAPRSRRRVLSRDYDRVKNGDNKPIMRNSLIKREFPNPDNYEDPRLSRSPKLKAGNGYMDGSSKTSSFEFSRNRHENELPKKGDFNEVGIPIIDPHGGATSDSATSDPRFLKDVKSLINRYEQNSGQEEMEGDQVSMRSADESRNRTEGKVVSGIPLVAMVPKRPSSRGQSSSGFSSLIDIQEKHPDVRSESRVSNNSKSSGKGSKGTLCTDL